jgi:lactoylglutathione lyase
MARMVGINHVALTVGDVDEAVEFYGRIFELELRGRVPGMAFLDMGDQFLALAHSKPGTPDRDRHFGLVVDDRAKVRQALREAGVDVESGHGLHFSDPWGNRVEVVQYSEIQFTKAPPVLAGMGLENLGKSESAQRELRDKGLGP